jgi:hypothetical protein
LYVDHAHPEYSAPEVTNPRDAVVFDRAGELVAAYAMDLLAGEAPEQAPANDPRHGDPVVLYKNNTDGKGASYGFHENYLMTRETPFERIVTDLTPFFVARPLICGAGRVGIGAESGVAGFQISSRADFFEQRVGLETTFRRPIINTRDEPHATAERYRRLHVIVGDATFADVAGLVRMGATSLVLGMIEAGGLAAYGVRGGDLMPHDPVAAMHVLSHDPTLRATVRTESGRTITGLQLQWAYYQLVQGHLARSTGGEVDPATAEVLLRWEDLLTRLEADPMSAASLVDWVAKLASWCRAIGSATGWPGTIRAWPLLTSSSRTFAPVKASRRTGGGPRPHRAAHRSRRGGGRRAHPSPRHPSLVPRGVCTPLPRRAGWRFLGLGHPGGAGRGGPATHRHPRTTARDP